MERLHLRADRGFTLVELLVAILILAILVAIGLGSFLSQRAKAQDTHAKTAVVTASKAMLAYETDHGDFSGAAEGDLVRIERSLVNARNLDVNAGARTFTVSVESPARGGTAYTIERTAAGQFIRDCTQPGVGGCGDELDGDGNRW